MDQLKQALEARTAETTDQPKLVSGGKMRDYQLEGLTWLTCLYSIGLNGILADEMGLGKTVQLISFVAFLREQGTNGPFLILGPLSTVRNWVNEFQRWTPDIPVIMYHGSPQERGRLRRQEMKGNSKGEKFPIICTSYEICMRDKKYLQNYQWKFMVVDEGHRLKNFNCKLVKELKQYMTESRLILTGTPLQNNLSELWSLLNFLLPEAFADLEQFESMFDISEIQGSEGERQLISKEQQKRTIAALHAILKPFLLRRVKTDVETMLPKKREYVLYAPLTQSQRELYMKIKDGEIREYLEEKAMERMTGSVDSLAVRTLKRKAGGSGTSTPNKSTKSSRASTPASSIRSARGRRRQNYTELSDREYFKQMEEGSESESENEEEKEERDAAETLKQVRKEVSNKKLQNPLMQLRLACNSPHHFFPLPEGPKSMKDLTTQSGKMLMLERLVPRLFKLHHKILIFSQFQKQLDILEDWAREIHNWAVCRIDGGVKADDRQEAIDDFNNDKNHRLFLLSTRAGGLGINLTAADTVILFDSDWNPQQDLQAQDRAHRIGQTKPVIVYRLATKGTVEQTLLEKADGKRRLEKIVIHKDKFRGITSKASLKRKSTADGDEEDDDYAELRRILDQSDDFNENGVGGKGEILTEDDLRILTDRSETAYAQAEKGAHAIGDKFRTVETRRDGQDILGSMG